jgi:hypothetical protein
MEQPEGRIVRHGLEALAVLTLALTSCVSEGQAYGPRFVTVRRTSYRPFGSTEWKVMDVAS